MENMANYRGENDNYPLNIYIKWIDNIIYLNETKFPRKGSNIHNNNYNGMTHEP